VAGSRWQVAENKLGVGELAVGKREGYPEGAILGLSASRLTFLVITVT
jgi:hypothetical protein